MASLADLMNIFRPTGNTGTATPMPPGGNGDFKGLQTDALQKSLMALPANVGQTGMVFNPNSPSLSHGPQGIWAQMQEKMKAPEFAPQLAIMLDTIGSAMDPKNPFAGVGRTLGQSKLASMSAEKTTKERQEMLKAFLKANMTPQGKDGTTSHKITMDKDGNIKFSTSGEGAGAGFNMTDLFSLMSGGKAQEAAPVQQGLLAPNSGMDPGDPYELPNGWDDEEENN